MTKHFLLVLIMVLIASVQSSGQSDNLMIELTIKNKIAFARLFVNGKEATFILDSGSSISLLDKEQADDFGFEYYPENGEGRIHGLGGKNIFNVTSSIKLTYNGEHSFKQRFYSTDIQHIKKFLKARKITVLGILGADFLIRHKAIIDYSRGFLVVTGYR